jgi:hypothetical protein
MITNIEPFTTTKNSDGNGPKIVNTSSSSEVVSATQKDASDVQTSTLSLSPLARQMANSAIRMKEMYQTHSRAQLVDKVSAWEAQIVGNAYDQNKVKYDSEIPNTDDPILLARAKQATIFVNNSRQGIRGGNPFSELSVEQLSNIIYDDSGTYTFNERLSAWSASYDQEEIWRVEVAAQAQREYNQSGKLTHFFKAVLDHYRGLPLIAQVQYPETYANDLEKNIVLDFNYFPHGSGGEDQTLGSSLVSCFFRRLQSTADHAVM